jgi:hypothetical protein
MKENWICGIIKKFINSSLVLVVFLYQTLTKFVFHFKKLLNHDFNSMLI